jgi:polysaccharide biosynthesis protein PslG
VRKPVIALFILFLSCNASAQNPRGDKTMRSDDTERSPFGVLEFLSWDHPWNNYQYPDRASLKHSIRLMKEAGVGFVRFDFGWQDIEPAQGEFRFEKFDAIVELLRENHIGILGILDYTATWASPDGRWNNPPRDNQLFVNYACKVIERYKGKVKYWEIWNEPDSPTYWYDQDGLKSYCVLLKEVYLAAKRVDPGCKILNGGIASGIASINRLYDNGAQEYFDILNVHIFETPFDRIAIKRAKAYCKLAYKIMKRNGDAPKKIWVTEIGCPGVKKGAVAANWWMGGNPDEKLQSEWVKQVFTELINEEAVGKVFWAFFRETDKHWDNGVDHFGLIRNDFSKKPAFNAYRNCFRKWKKSNL